MSKSPISASLVAVSYTHLLSIDSEGTDGTAPAAGGITDSQSLHTARGQGIDLHAALRGHACYEALDAIGDAVFTGNTGTNLCDLNILYVPCLLYTSRCV